MEKRRKSLLFMTFIVVASALAVNAQPGSNPNGGRAPGVTPISGIEILIGLGGLLGAKKLFNSRKKN